MANLAKPIGELVKEQVNLTLQDKKFIEDGPKDNSRFRHKEEEARTVKHVQLQEQQHKKSLDSNSKTTKAKAPKTSNKGKDKAPVTSKSNNNGDTIDIDKNTPLKKQGKGKNAGENKRKQDSKSKVEQQTICLFLGVQEMEKGQPQYVPGFHVPRPDTEGPLMNDYVKSALAVFAGRLKVEVMSKQALRYWVEASHQPVIF
ncbi:hypothetical protein CPB85DRAFT_1263744 [Mucidula mucida]|nr:hypothetical protein CPB85DRAFT_1263744 [Mucidula mucida]